MKKTILALAAVLSFASAAIAETTTVTTTIKTTPEGVSAITVSTPTPAPAPAWIATAPTPELMSKWTLPGPYVALQLGAYGPSDDQNYAAYEPDAGFAGNLVLGYRFSPYLSLQGELGYLSSEGYAAYDFYAMPVMAVLKLGIPVRDLELYALAGGGALFYTVDIGQTSSTDDVGMGGKLGLGANYYFGKFFVGAEVEYLMDNVSDAPNDGIIGYMNGGYKY